MTSWAVCTKKWYRDVREHGKILGNPTINDWTYGAKWTVRNEVVGGKNKQSSNHEACTILKNDFFPWWWLYQLSSDA